VVLAGVMGMNFHMPFFDDTENFFIVVASMVVLGAVILAIARWRDWLWPAGATASRARMGRYPAEPYFEEAAASGSDVL